MTNDAADIATVTDGRLRYALPTAIPTVAPISAATATHK
jgi:hypothetical protein